MKTCTFCKQQKPLSEFNKNRSRKDGLQTKCRPCGQAKFKEYYNDNKEHHRSVVMANTTERVKMLRQYVYEYFLENPCVDCGTKDIRVLEFDHLPAFKKIKEVSKLVCGGYSLETVKAEISKCEVRCRNCHTIKTYERMGGSWHDVYLTTI